MHDVLFDPMSTTLRTLLEERVKLDILVYEPRIELLELEVEPRRGLGELTSSSSTGCARTNSRYNLVFPFYHSDSNEVARSAAGALSWTSSNP